MSTGFAGTERYDATRHDVTGFSCGVGHGIGTGLLNDALARLVRASEQVAVRTVIVHAVDDSAASFYGRFGFHTLTATPLTLMVTLGELRDAGYA